MQPGFEGRAEYLSLALFAQNMVSAIKGDDPVKLDAALTEALESLRDVRSSEVKRFGRRDAAAFNSYQQIAALHRAWSDEDQNSAVSLLETVRGNPSGHAAEADQLVRLFTRLQVQALWNFERPESPPIEELHQLCRTAP